MAISITIGAVLLLAATVAFIYFKLSARNAPPLKLNPSGRRPAAPPRRADEVSRRAATRVAEPTPRRASAQPMPSAPVRAGESAAELRLKLLNCFFGDRAVMERNIAFEAKKHPELSEVDVLRKILYDISRGR